MSAHLLATKLYLPPIRPALVIRPRLLQQLDEGLYCKLTLLSAPAGFGKTTLLAEWAAGLCGRAQVAWLTIDQADNDPRRFLEYLCAALQKVYPGVAESLPASPDFLRPGFEPFLTAVFNEVKEASSPLVLALDDYHLIDEQAIHQAIDFLLDHQPAQFHLVLATRADPPLRLSRLRGRSQLNEIRLADLRFSLQETDAFLNQGMGLSLAPEQVSSLATRTEGWIAGLHLAALSLRGQEDPGRFVRTFTGSTHFILDYLTDEVFQLQPAHIQDFLLRTAILTRLCGPLCDAVCQLSPGQSQKILDYLEHANLFLLPLDDQRKWYRYHQLFADLLQQRLSEEQPELAPVLCRRASDWCSRNELSNEAVEYAFSSADLEHTTDLIETLSQGLLMHGQSATLLRWLDRLPSGLVDQRISLVVDQAWAMLFSSRPIDLIQSRLDYIDSQSTGQPGGSSFAIRTLPLRAMLALYRGQIDQAVEMALRSLETLDTDQVYLRGVANLVHAMSLTIGDHLEQYQGVIQQVAAIGEKTGNVLVTVLALVSLAENKRKLGRLHESYAHLELAVQLGVNPLGHRLPIAGRALIGLGDLRREWNDLHEARRLTQEGIDLLEQAELVGAFHGYLALARIEHAVGDLAASRQAINKAFQYAAAFDLTDLDDQTVALLEARLSILQGELEVANRWVEGRHLTVVGDLSLQAEGQDNYLGRLRKYELAVLARLQLAQNKPRQALALLQALFSEFERVDRPAMRIEIRLLQALAYHAQGEQALALEAIEQALILAEPEGYIRMFLDEGDGVIALLRLAAARPAAVRPASTTAYLNRLLSEAGAPVASPPAQITAASPIETLSGREMEVLRLLASSLSAGEIADELVVSPSTVHSHIKSIYAKLEVHSRYQAVAKARALKLI